MEDNVKEMFTDAICNAPSFSLRDTLGENPLGDIGAASGVQIQGSVTPEVLPKDKLFHLGK